MTKLKPCPFCGNKEVILMSCAICDGYIYCDGCGFETKRYWDDLKNHKVVKSWQEKAIAAWNRRDGEQIMKTVIATIIEKNEYRIEIDVENDATEDEIWDAVKEVYLEDDYNNMAKVDSNYDIKIKKQQVNRL